MNISHKKKIIFASLLVLAACAKQSAPTGGPKDEKPPVALQSSPINYATNFNGKKIIIEFDEYLNLQNVNSELLVSPPLEKRPKILMRGKKLVIHINNA